MHSFVIVDAEESPDNVESIKHIELPNLSCAWFSPCPSPLSACSLCTLSITALSLHSSCAIKSASVHRKWSSSTASGSVVSTLRGVSHALVSGCRSSPHAEMLASGSGQGCRGVLTSRKTGVPEALLYKGGRNNSQRPG